MPNNQYGAGFVIRLVILLLILAMVAVSFIVDMTIKDPQSAKTVKDVNELLQAETDDGHGISKDMIQKAVGSEPSQLHDVGKYKVEQYNFRRTIPFFTLRKLFVVYDAEDAVTLFEQQSLPTEQMIKRQLGPDIYNPGVPPPDKLPRVAGSGFSVPSADDKKTSDGKSNEESEDKSADAAKESDHKPADDKKDDANTPEKSTDKDASTKAGDVESKDNAPAEVKPEEKKPDNSGGGQSTEGDKKPDEGKGG